MTVQQLRALVFEAIGLEQPVSNSMVFVLSQLFEQFADEYENCPVCECTIQQKEPAGLGYEAMAASPNKEVSNLDNLVKEHLNKIDRDATIANILSVQDALAYKVAEARSLLYITQEAIRHLGVSKDFALDEQGIAQPL